MYAYCPPSEHKNLKDCIEYVTRYVGSPVMDQSRIIDYNSDMDHVIWWYEDHETKEYVEVYDSILAFMKKLIRHIPDEHFKMVRYIGGYAAKKKKLTKMIKKMVSCKYAGLAKKNYAHRQYLMDTFRIDPLLCKCGHEMQFVEAFFSLRIGGTDK